MDKPTDQQLADLCRQFQSGEKAMGTILRVLQLPPNRAQQASYKMLCALRRVELAKKGVELR